MKERGEVTIKRRENKWTGKWLYKLANVIPGREGVERKESPQNNKKRIQRGGGLQVILNISPKRSRKKPVMTDRRQWGTLGEG